MSDDKELKQEEQEQNVSDQAQQDKKETINEIKKLQEENSELKDKWQRALADYQNLERRTQTEISQRVSENTNNLLLNFLNIYEDFLRAENSLSKEEINTDGIKAVIKNMETVLSENNIKQIDAVGEIFDPQLPL